MAVALRCSVAKSIAHKVSITFSPFGCALQAPAECCSPIRILPCREACTWACNLCQTRVLHVGRCTRTPQCPDGASTTSQRNNTHHPATQNRQSSLHSNTTLPAILKSMVTYGGTKIGPMGLCTVTGRNMERSVCSAKTGHERRNPIILEFMGPPLPWLKSRSMYRGPGCRHSSTRTVGG